MYAVEFTATVKDGMIKIPPQYVLQLQTSCRVIILQNEPAISTQTKQSEKDQFLPKVAQQRFDLPSIENALGLDLIQIDTKQWKFRREEIYERNEHV